MKSAEPVFAVNRFVSHVFRYQQERNIKTMVMARKIGITKEALARIYRREAEPSLAVICALADVCKFSLDDYRKVDPYGQLGKARVA